MKIIADDKIPFLKGALEPFGEVKYIPGQKTTAADVKDADAIITRTRTKCNASLLEGSSVRFIATATIGHDHIDTGYCDSKNIFWTNAPGCNSASVAQYMSSVLLTLALNHDIALNGKTLGVVGVGNVGSKVAKVGRALGMNVLLNDPPRARIEGGAAFTELDELLKKADFVSIHVPLYNDGVDKTFHMADKAFFAKLSNRQFFINASRGEVTDTAALKDALRNASIRAAVLDVWENEPEIDRELLALCSIATPHIAGYSTDGKANGTSMSVNALGKYFGIDTKNWFPANVPLPEKTLVTINLSETDSLEKLLSEAVFFSYNVMDDDRKLRNSPDTFEKQRGDYPLRREFPVFSVKINGAPSKAAELKAALVSLGFNVL